MYLASLPLLLTNPRIKKPSTNLILTVRADDDKLKSRGRDISNCKMTRKTLMAGFELQGAAENHKLFFSKVRPISCSTIHTRNLVKLLC